jgi:hypothetical protein
MARDQIAAAIESPVIGYLGQPGAGGATLRIEEGSLAKDEEEHFLDQILCF